MFFLDRNTFLRFNQKLENYLKKSVGNDVYNLEKNNKQEIVDITLNGYTDTGGYF